MGSVLGMLGLGGGANGTNVQAPQQATLDNAVNSGTAQTAQAGTSNALNQNQSLLNALQTQNGIGNQSSVFNQLQGVANGTGPNPAQAMLNQATNANNQTTSAQIASQRGVNAGLAARLGAEQGAANQQNAAAQGATMQANQSLGALGQLGGLATQQVNQQIGQTNANTQAQLANTGMQYGALQGQNQNAVASQSNVNNVNGQLANTQSGQQGNAITGVASGAAGLLTGGLFAKGGNVPNYDEGTTNVQAPQAPTTFDVAKNIGQQMAGKTQTPTPPGPKSSVGQFLKGSSSGGPSAYDIGNQLGKGVKALFGTSTPTPGPTPGKVTSEDMQGDLTASDRAQQMPATEPGSDTGAKSMATDASVNEPEDADNTQAYALGGSIRDFMTQLAMGGPVPALVSPGEGYIPPHKVQDIKKGKTTPLKAAEKIPGKAKVEGDSLKNDTVSKTLQSGGMVLPRSVMTAKHPAWEAHKFVSAHLGLPKSRKVK